MSKVDREKRTCYWGIIKKLKSSEFKKMLRGNKCRFSACTYSLKRQAKYLERFQSNAQSRIQSIHTFSKEKFAHIENFSD